MTYRAVAWDIDGTLVDSEPLHQRALSAVSEAYRVDLSDLSDDDFVGVDMHGVWRLLKDRYPAGLDETEWLERIDAFYAEHSSALVPVCGAVDTVRALAGRGIPQAAVSNSNRTVVDINLMALGIADLFDFTLSLDDVPAGKPDPRPYRMAAERFRLAPARVLAVEDSETGARAAHRAGLAVAFFGTRRLGFPVTPITALSDVLEMPVASSAETHHGP